MSGGARDGGAGASAAPGPLALFRAYPELGEALDGLAAGASWCMTGASALLCDDESWLFELTKPKSWRRRADGATVVGIGAIGGSLEADEAILDGLRREVAEEIGAGLAVRSAPQTYIVHERRDVHVVDLPPRPFPRPALLTVSANLYRRHLRPECAILAIATFLARLEGRAELCDIYGLLRVPHAALEAVLLREQISGEQLAGEPISRDELAAIPGVAWQTREPLPERAVLAPVWTVHSLQVLLRAGHRV
jgi:8-oxo-dGTP pyrophosphatase MutT (NUDIX family)